MRFHLYEPPKDNIKMLILGQSTEDMRKWLDCVGKGYVLTFSANRANATPNAPNGHDWTVELELSRAKGMVQFHDARPFYQRWWSAIKLYWFRNSHPELWEHEKA